MSLIKNKKVKYPLVITLLLITIISIGYFLILPLFKKKPVEAAWWDENRNLEKDIAF